MTNQPTLILFATNRPLLVLGFFGVLHRAGFEGEPVMRDPREALAAVPEESAWLIFVDAKHASDPVTLAEAVRRSPQSRFVLCGSAISPELVQVAVDAGMHGVLSTGLPIDEAAEALARIWQGERHFRFGGERAFHTAPPPPAVVDFDAEWMFGIAV